MTTTAIGASASEQLTWEAGGWITRRTLLHDLRPDAAFLLAQSAEPRPGNLRFAIQGAQAYLLGELPDADGLFPMSEAHHRLFAAADVTPIELSEVDVACTLGESGYCWAQSPNTTNYWQATVNDPSGQRYELSATLTRTGIEVESQIAESASGFGESQQLALARFLMAAHARIRFARFTLQSHAVSVVSHTASDRMNIELPSSVGAVVAASRLVGSEVRALATQAVAQAYLRATACM